MLGLKLIHVSERGPWVETIFETTASREDQYIHQHFFYFYCDWIVHLYIAITTNLS